MTLREGKIECSYSEEFDYFLKKLTPILVDYVKTSESFSSKALEYKSPKDLISELNLEAQPTGCDKSNIISDIEKVLKYSPSTFNPGFLSKLYASTTPIGVISELITAVLNGNNHIYLASPVATLAEVFLAKELGKLVGYDAEVCGGITSPGGSASNNLALLTARNYYFPYITEHGLCLTAKQIKKFNHRTPVIFTSMSSHYSIEKSASMLGLGAKNIVNVPTDLNGAMDPVAFETLVENQIQLGNRPFFVNVTSGTTTMGSFDPIDKIYAVCKKYDIWLHVDGSLGGHMIFLEEQRASLLSGLEFSNSFTFNPHKGLGVPLQCSYLLLRDGVGVVRKSISLNANYLFHNSDSQGFDSPSSWDIGDLTVGCGRKPDSLKLWLTWRYYGTNGLSERVQKAVNNASLFSNLISRSYSFILFRKPASTIVCFWYIPASIRKSIDLTVFDNHKVLYPPELGDATKRICDHVNFNSKISIDYASTILSYKGTLVKVPEFFRIPFNSPLVTSSVIEEILCIIESSAKALGI